MKHFAVTLWFVDYRFEPFDFGILTVAMLVCLAAAILVFATRSDRRE